MFSFFRVFFVCFLFCERTTVFSFPFLFLFFSLFGFQKHKQTNNTMSKTTVNAQNTSAYSLDYHERPETNLVTLPIKKTSKAHKVCDCVFHLFFMLFILLVLTFQTLMKQNRSLDKRLDVVSPLLFLFLLCVRATSLLCLCFFFSFLPPFFSIPVRQQKNT